MQTLWAKTPDAQGLPTTQLNTSGLGPCQGGLPHLEAVGASPVSEMHNLPLILGKTLVTSRQPWHQDPHLEAVLIVVLATWSMSIEVLAVWLGGNTTHCNNSGIHGITSGAGGMS